MKSSARKIQLASYDDLFKNDEERLADTQDAYSNAVSRKIAAVSESSV